MLIKLTVDCRKQFFKTLNCFFRESKRPLVGLEATSKMQKGRNLCHNIAKITKISPFSAVTFFIYQNFPETNCENDFFITFTDFLAKSFELTVYSYNHTYS